MRNRHPFKKRLLATCVTACSVAGWTVASAQTDDILALEEVTVTGVRSAQQTAVNIKRDADSIVDAIAAEDIGKLPDVTISDSLQRIGGVQIRRNAGEGGSLNIRGLGQVMTMMNGESYLGANSITTVQPDFSDIPSQLFSGAEVIKSQTAANHPGGITGIVDLKTYRPLSSGFDTGLTLSGAVQVGRGQESGETDPSVNVLANWRNERFGIMASFAHQQSNLANYYAGMTGGGADAGWSGFAGENWAYDWVTPNTQLGNMGERVSDGSVDINNDGDFDDTYYAFEGNSVYNRFTERERNGVNLALQGELADGLEVVAEFFYTEMEDYNRIMGVVHEDKWQRWGHFMPTARTDAGVRVEDGSRDLYYVQEFTSNGRRFKSYSEVQAQTAESQNFNLEVNYDRGGPFVAKARLVHGEAQQQRLNSYMDIDLAHGNQWGVECQYYPPGTPGVQGDCEPGQLQTNPEGYRGYPVLTVNYAGSDPVWSGFDNNANLNLDGSQVPGAGERSLANYIDDVNSYALGALSSENNFAREGTLNVARLDGSYELGHEIFTSIDAGIRFSSRSVENFEFDLLSPIGGCDVKWKATDVDLDGGGIADACTYGDGTNFYTAGVPIPLADLDPVRVSDFGSTSGIPPVWVADPSSMDNVETYHENLYPGTSRSENPGRSYDVDLDELSSYVKANFAYGLMSGNLGARIVSSDLNITQNEVGIPRPYGAANEKIGEAVTDRSYSDFLPSLNLRFDLADDVILRASANKTMAPLDLAQWGTALAPNYAIDSDPESETYNRFIVIGANADGNPELDPWRATNYDLSLEYYLGSASALTASLFYVDIESFIESRPLQMELPDQDGVVRRSVSVSTSVQGSGGSLEGIELSAKLAFSDFLNISLLENFGTDANYTYSPSESGNQDLSGNDLPFQDNSEHVMNLVGWYESGRFQARLAYNYRSERVVAFDQTWGEGTLWQQPTGYIDASLSYDVSDQVTVFMNGSNVTNEKEEYYLESEDQFAWQNEYEARYTLGVRGTF